MPAIQGKVSPSSAESLEDVEATAISIYVPISKHVFHLLTVPQGKYELFVTIEVDDGGYPADIFIDSISGAIDVIVPEPFDGDYQIDLHNGARLLEMPSTTHRSPRKIRIVAYRDVRIKIGD
ncbi:hypothetical protein [Streptococcus danieliae]|uniref:hypothetical protein n=1 Tax=Streptococcus danieliae TaxID=747656 RepID=UPI0021CA64CB|nr:hypothetical protein [Streptococcus danieliae]MCU0081944.1 hypothetical protein [Streptococcus danieliae]